jgi:hypothetical protein
MEPPGGARHRWENREVEWAGAHESKREPSEFPIKNGQRPPAFLLSLANLPTS